jgi:hypothetical protein
MHLVKVQQMLCQQLQGLTTLVLLEKLKIPTSSIAKSTMRRNSLSLSIIEDEFL